MNEIYHALTNIFGLDAQPVNFYQMVARAAFVYIASLVIIRFGNKRFLGKNTAFDFVIGIVIGSVFSRAINGQGPLFVTIAAGLTLVGLHWLFAIISMNHKGISNLVKGKTSVIVENNKPDKKEMRKGHVSEDDLKEQLRIWMNQKDLDNIKEAYLERDGQISFIRNDHEPKILDVKVEEGVQTVRIKLE